MAILNGNNFTFYCIFDQINMSIREFLLIYFYLLIFYLIFIIDFILIN